MDVVGDQHVFEAGTLRCDRIRDEGLRTVLLGGEPVTDLHIRQIPNARIAKRVAGGSGCYLTRYQQ
jgi:hypothetical protein